MSDESWWRDQILSYIKDIKALLVNMKDTHAPTPPRAEAPEMLEVIKDAVNTFFPALNDGFQTDSQLGPREILIHLHHKDAEYGTWYSAESHTGGIRYIRAALAKPTPHTDDVVVSMEEVRLARDFLRQHKHDVALTYLSRIIDTARPAGEVKVGRFRCEECGTVAHWAIRVNRGGSFFHWKNGDVNAGKHDVAIEPSKEEA